jgi:hypothetical protein
MELILSFCASLLMQFWKGDFLGIGQVPISASVMDSDCPNRIVISGLEPLAVGKWLKIAMECVSSQSVLFREDSNHFFG